MIKIEDYIKCYENVLDYDLCKEIVKDVGIKDFQRAMVNDSEISKKRNCHEKQLNKKYNKDLYTAVGNILKKYGQDFGFFNTGLTVEDTGYQHLLYRGSEKGEYTTHVDHFDLAPRVLSISFILNEDYDGGDFSFFNDEFLIKKKIGSACVFPSNFCYPHRVTPVTNGDRHAVITWIH